jgi:hypothetical protein
VSQEQLDIIDSVDLKSLVPVNRGRPSVNIPPVMTYTRDLTSEDLFMLANAPTRPLSETMPQLQNLRATHHALARLVAQGKTAAECSAVTGHTLVRIYNLTNHDEGFKDLVQHYKAIEQQIFVDVTERLANLGLATIEELQERLEVKPGQFSNNDLFKMAELALDRSGSSPKPGTPGAASRQPGVNISVSFVAPKAQKEPQTIEGQATEVKTING